MTTQAVLTGLLLASAAVWTGGLVTLVVVATSARRVLEPAARVEFLRDLGGRYLPVGASALAVSFASGLLLLLSRPWTPAATAASVLALALAGALAAGVAQARRVSTLRQAAAQQPGEAALVMAVRTGARQAAVLRTGLALLSIALIVTALLAA